MSRLCCCALVLATLPPALLAQEQSGRKTFVYKKTPQGELELVVHFPPDWSPRDRRPAIVFFFGGGWKSGKITQFETQADYLASRGMVAGRADYRVRGRHGTTPDKCVEDGKSAVRWLRQNAARLGIDPDRVAAGGGSAGGHVAAATFTAKAVEPAGEDPTVSSRPNLLVLFNPALNTANERVAAIIGDPTIARAISPVGSLTRDVPPAVLFFGTDDGLLTGAKEYLAEAKALGVEAELYTAEGQKHGFFNRTPWREATLAQADRFLARHGYLTGPPTLKVSPEARLQLAAGTR